MKGEEPPTGDTSTKVPLHPIRVTITKILNLPIKKLKKKVTINEKWKVARRKKGKRREIKGGEKE